MPTKAGKRAILIYRLPESLSPRAEKILGIKQGEVHQKVIDVWGVTMYFKSYSSAKKLIEKKTFDIDGDEYSIYPLITYLTIHNVKPGEWKNCLKKLLKERISQIQLVQVGNGRISLSKTYRIQDRKYRNDYRVILNCAEDIFFLPPYLLEDLKDPVGGKEFKVTFFCYNCREDGHYRRICNFNEVACASSDEKVEIRPTFLSSCRLLPPKKISEDEAFGDSTECYSDEDITIIEDDEDSSGETDYWKEKLLLRKDETNTSTLNDSSSFSNGTQSQMEDSKVSPAQQMTSDSLVTTLVKSSSDTWAVKSKEMTYPTQNEVKTENEEILVIDISDDELVIDISDDELVIDISDDEVPLKVIKTDDKQYIEQQDSNSPGSPALEPSELWRVLEKIPAKLEPTPKGRIRRVPVLLDPAQLTVTLSFKDFKMTPPKFWELKEE